MLLDYEGQTTVEFPLPSWSRGCGWNDNMVQFYLNRQFYLAVLHHPTRESWLAAVQRLILARN